MAEVKANQNKLLSTNKSQSDELSALSQKVDDLVLRTNFLSADNESLKSRITIIEEKMTSFKQSVAGRNPAFCNNVIEMESR